MQFSETHSSLLLFGFVFVPFSSETKKLWIDNTQSKNIHPHLFRFQFGETKIINCKLFTDFTIFPLNYEFNVTNLSNQGKPWRCMQLRCWLSVLAFIAWTFHINRISSQLNPLVTARVARACQQLLPCAARCRFAFFFFFFSLSVIIVFYSPFFYEHSRV